MTKKEPEWSNVPPSGANGVPRASLDAEMRKPTPREEHVAALGEKDKEVKPLAYTVASKADNKALRVIHDYYGNKITLQPGQVRQGVILRPATAAYLGKGDLVVTAAQ